MAAFRIDLTGSNVLNRDGEPVRLRTQMHALLLASLAVHGSLERRDLAEALWPDAAPPNALAYLRRTLMELRRLGIGIVDEGSRLALEPDVESERSSTQEILPDIDHPAAVELRRLVRRERVVTPVRLDQGEDPYAFLGRALAKHDPDSAASLAVEAWDDMKFQVRPELLLDLLTDLLRGLDGADPHRLRLLLHAGWAADMVTRYGLAEKFFREALAAAERAGETALVARALLNLTTVLTNLRRWGVARKCVDRAVEAAGRVGDQGRLASAFLNRGNLRWRLLDVAGGAEDYHAAIRNSANGPEGASLRLLATSQLTFLRVGMGHPTGPIPALPETTEPAHGFAAMLLGNLRFWSAFECEDWDAAVDAAIRRLELSADDNTEAIFTYALDYVACLLARMGRQDEAAACVRVGARLRRQIGSPRSPGERLLLRRHLKGGLFGPGALPFIRAWGADDPVATARRLAGHLRRL